MVTTISPEIRRASRVFAAVVEDRLRYKIHALAWNFDPEMGRWLLVVLTNASTKKGPIKVFEAIQSAHKEGTYPFEFLDVTLGFPGVNDAVVQMAKLVAVPRNLNLEPPPEFVNVTFNGLQIDHAWLLWSDPPRQT